MIQEKMVVGGNNNIKNTNTVLMVRSVVVTNKHHMALKMLCL